MARRAERLLGTALRLPSRARHRNSVLDPERAGHLGDAAAADAVFAVLTSLDLLKRDADGFAELLLAPFSWSSGGPEAATDIQINGIDHGSSLRIEIVSCRVSARYGGMAGG